MNLDNSSYIIGLGNDIIEIERIRQSYERHGYRFLTKLFTEKEQDYCLKHKDPIPHMAGRFAAKEAVSKALGCGIGKKLSFHDIEIFHDDQKKPKVRLSDEVMILFNHPKIEISLSHSNSHAIAYCIAFF